MRNVIFASGYSSAREINTRPGGMLTISLVRGFEFGCAIDNAHVCRAS